MPNKKKTSSCYIKEDKIKIVLCILRVAVNRAEIADDFWPFGNDSFVSVSFWAVQTLSYRKKRKCQ